MGGYKMIRQGDILLEKVNEIPQELKRREDRTLALGEKTGHHHTFSGQVLVFGEMGKEQFADVQQESVLEHQEHENIKVPEGKYRVVQQREFDIVEGIRQVTD
jgi:hypothetical protein